MKPSEAIEGERWWGWGEGGRGGTNGAVWIDTSLIPPLVVWLRYYRLMFITAVQSRKNPSRNINNEVCEVPNEFWTKPDVAPGPI